jgi:hypothetical protein
LANNAKSLANNVTTQPAMQALACDFPVVVAATAFGVAAGVAFLQLAQLVGVACNGIG